MGVFLSLRDFSENEGGREKGMTRVYEIKAFGDASPYHPLNFELMAFTEMHLRINLICMWIRIQIKFWHNKVSHQFALMCKKYASKNTFSNARGNYDFSLWYRWFN